MGGVHGRGARQLGTGWRPGSQTLRRWGDQAARPTIAQPWTHAGCPHSAACMPCMRAWLVCGPLPRHPAGPRCCPPTPPVAAGRALTCSARGRRGRPGERSGPPPAGWAQPPEGGREGGNGAGGRAGGARRMRSAMRQATAARAVAPGRLPSPRSRHGGSAQSSPCPAGARCCPWSR